MKKFLTLLVLVSSVLLFNVNMFSQPVPMRSVQLNETQVFENLLKGVNAENKGLCASCAFLMGELCCSKSVIPLMKLLHCAECEEVRIVAALSLCKIGDARGIYAIKGSAKFDESARVRRMCTIFYNAFVNGEVEKS